MNVLIIGLGSIARKHIRAIRSIHPDCGVYALRRTGSNNDDYEGVVNLYALSELSGKPDFVIISNPTNKHKDAILQAMTLGCPLFIEKPVLAHPRDAMEIMPVLEAENPLNYVACNLRFHPCLNFIRERMAAERWTINEVNAYCGSNLATWRPDTDYTKSYSASEEAGGGVHLDLIHELDYCYWIFGRPDATTSLKRKVSSLDITSKDFAVYHLCYPGFTINVTLNYYRITARRDLEILTDQDVWHVDLIKARVEKNGEVVFEDREFKMEHTYIAQMQYFLNHIRDGKLMMNAVPEALEVLKIAVAE